MYFLLEKTVVMPELMYGFWRLCSCWHYCSSEGMPGLGMIGSRMTDDRRVVMVDVRSTAERSSMAPDFVGYKSQTMTRI